MRRAFADTATGQLHYREAGSGAAVLLLHPTPYSSRYYLDFAPLLTGFRALAPDLPGCGESCALPAGATVDSLAGTVCQFMDALGLERAHVLGIHGGNKIAAALAANHPQRVERLVFAGMTHSIILDRELRNAEVRAAAARTQAPTTKVPFALDGWNGLLDTLGKVWARAREGTDLPQPAALRRLADEAVDRIQSREAFDALYQANFAFDLEAALRRVRAATLAVEMRVRREERIPPQALLIAAALSDGRAVTLIGTDRELIHEGAPRLSHVVLDFLRA